MSAVQGIICDGCDTTYALERTVIQPKAWPARERAKQMGWHTARGTYQSVSGERGYSRDLCPTCWKAGRR